MQFAPVAGGGGVVVPGVPVVEGGGVVEPAPPVARKNASTHTQAPPDTELLVPVASVAIVWVPAGKRLITNRPIESAPEKQGSLIPTVSTGALPIGISGNNELRDSRFQDVRLGGGAP